jgi:hypothetical protein
MPIDVFVGGTLTRVYPTAKASEYDLPKNTQTFTANKLNFYAAVEEMEFKDYSAK